MSDENTTTPPAANAAGCSVDPVVLPLPLGLAQRSGKCRICGIHFRDGLIRGWAHEFKEMLFPQHVILNYGEECAHAECLKRQNDQALRPARSPEQKANDGK